MKLPGSQLHLCHWRKKNCSSWIGKILKILPPARKAGYSDESSCVFPWFCTMPCAEGLDVGEVMLARSPVLAILTPSQLLLSLVSWSRAAFSATCGLLLFRTKSWSSSLFFHPLFNHSLKYLVGKIYEKTKRVCWSSISPLSWVCFFLSVLVPNPAKYILRKISYVKHENRWGNV